MALAIKDLLDHVEMKPEQATLRETPEWKVADLKALGVLVKFLSPSYQTILRETSSAAQAWGFCVSFFVKQNLHNRVQLRKELHEFKMPAVGNLMKHLMAFDDICLRLTAVGDAMAEDERVIILLESLPQEYDGMVKIIEAHGKVSLLEAKEMLRREFNTMQKREKGETAFQANGQGNQPAGQYGSRGNRQGRNNGGGRGCGNRSGRGTYGGRSSTDGFRGKCFQCGKQGHKRVDCPQENTKGVADEFLFSAAETVPSAWLLYSGASAHMTSDLNDYMKFEELTESLTITVANGERLLAKGKGTVKFILSHGKIVYMTDVLYIPGINRKLVSVSALASKGVQLSFGPDGCTITHGDKIVSHVKKQGRLYIWDVSADKRGAGDATIAASSVAGANMDIWHARLGHIPAARMMTAPKAVKGVPVFPAAGISEEPCGGCARGKLTVKAFSRQAGNQVKTRMLLELIHSDVMGPMNSVSRGGARYVVCFVDNYSRFVCLHHEVEE